MDWIRKIINPRKIKTKMLVLIIGVVLISILPLSIIVLLNNQSVILEKTFEVCRNLGENISRLATEELFMNETYDTTRTAINQLKDSKVSGLVNVSIVNVDGIYVAELSGNKIGQKLTEEEFNSYFSLVKLDYSEIKNSEDKEILRFVYPIFIQYRENKIRIGAAIFDFDKKEVYYPVQKIRNTIILVSGVLLTIAIGIALIASVLFSKPIQKLTEGARLIGQGQLDHRIHLDLADEIGELANTFNHMTEQIQDFTQNLEQKVLERTEQLNQSLKNIQELKEKQDGDYYLTSLLLQPLQKNGNTSIHCSVEFLVEQKKKFSFRKRESEIGGDICIADTIVLDGKEYVVFINGDAMGKSIQGAGGAIVLGVVFHSGLMRSRITKNQNIPPEIWIKERFLDLQNVFSSFDGSMFISVCLGIIDTLTGVMYYINAEHPWTVLFRDGKASFLEQESELRKLGTPENENHFFIRMFKLLPGDAVITGSDGRDDISKVDDDKDRSSINTDETLFLRLLELAEGDLKNTLFLIQQEGFLTDDVSLLKITYEPKYNGKIQFKSIVPTKISSIIDNIYIQDKSNLEEQIEYINQLESVEKLIYGENSYPDIIAKISEQYILKKEYHNAIELLEESIRYFPNHNRSLFLLACAYKESGNLEKAADTGERLNLRDPKNAENLFLLLEVYRELNIGSKISTIRTKLRNLGLLNQDDSLITENVEQFLEEGNLAYNEGDYEKALENYLKYSYSYPLNPNIYFKIGNCYTKLNRPKDAIDAYLTCIQMDPTNIAAKNNLATNYIVLNQIEEASKQWKEILELNPNLTVAQINLKKLTEKLSKKNPKVLKNETML